METVSAAALAAPSSATIYRCARCGIQSAERLCFAIPAKRTPPTGKIRCIGCVQTQKTGFTAALNLLLGLMSMPIAIYYVVNHSFVGLTAGLILAGMGLVVLGLILHELGHALTALLLGLDLGAILIGYGRKVAAWEIRGVPIRLYSFPTSGRVYIGGLRPRLMKLRVWLTYLMGPGTNALLAIAGIVWHDGHMSVLGRELTTLWIAFNGLMAVANLIPYRITEFGQSIPNDGLALVKIPRYTDKDFAVFAYIKSWVLALSRFEDGRYREARDACLRAAESKPDEIQLQLTLAACHSFLNDNAATVAVLRPLASQADLNPLVHAVLKNNLAFGLLMSHDASQEADRLSAEAYGSFPCMLLLRCTRALVLAASGRATESLAILDYAPFEKADRKTRGHWEAAKAFAHHQLGRADEASACAQRALKLDPWNATTLNGLGAKGLA